ncbi:IS200/IS605 family accessory protein TnpB-related protein [Clostridium sp. CS001]|uniref:IS200/IS605 family accessory protein TnpB-related protein n=1 Tax=Clostridium sp. CS001 TaxID=2880648 RepID=UPI001CF246E7|nr:IS200/IS605 family accessory protein TnpB-related protein [Clostridium sp. CS001]MCB2290668.1 IS200/IS605 family accessory protein TnpB-related protein [Clostridium sp. CS001]
MKVTIKAVLINIDEEKINIINNLMTVFCSAVRYSFKRILNNIKISDIEKAVAFKYGLNIRQSKDAVENARQTIVSQKELVKLNYENYLKKVNAILKFLNDTNKRLSDKKRNALMNKLDKRQRKLQYYKHFIDTNTIPPVIFGTKEMFLKRCKGLIKKEEWQEIRSNRVYSRGDKTKKGNPNLRIVTRENKNFLEVSTLDKTESNRAVKVNFEVYLPQKLSTTTGKVNGRNYKQMFLDYMQTGEAYQVELIRKNGKYYCHITFEESIVTPYENLYTGHKGIIGIDTNPNGFALTMIDNKGNYKWHTYLKSNELTYTGSHRRKNLCGELVKKVALIAKAHDVGIAVEDLKFHSDKDVTKKFARIKSQFIYRQLLTMLESTCNRNGIEIVKVKPQFTSKIGLYKYCHQYGMVVHNGASMVIGRRSYKFKEKIPKLLKQKIVTDLEKFEKKNEWSKWNEINKNIKRKVGENPALWLINRKKVLGIV